MKFIRNPRIFNDDILSSNICIPLFIEEKKKKKQNKHVSEVGNIFDFLAKRKNANKKRRQYTISVKSIESKFVSK